jgi:hypothetical protein
MIGYQSCISSIQALVMARAVELSGPEVFSVTVANDEWIVWFRFDDPRKTDSISTHFLRLWKEEQEFQRRTAATRKAPNRKSPAKRKPKNPAS